MENEPRDAGIDFVEDLCLHYQEMERSKALQLHMCDLMLASGNREWMSASETKLGQTEPPRY